MARIVRVVDPARIAGGGVATPGTVQRGKQFDANDALALLRLGEAIGSSPLVMAPFVGAKRAADALAGDEQDPRAAAAARLAGVEQPAARAPEQAAPAAAQPPPASDEAFAAGIRGLDARTQAAIRRSAEGIMLGQDPNVLVQQHVQGGMNPGDAEKVLGIAGHLVQMRGGPYPDAPPAPPEAISEPAAGVEEPPPGVVPEEAPPAPPEAPAAEEDPRMGAAVDEVALALRQGTPPSTVAAALARAGATPEQARAVMDRAKVKAAPTQIQAPTPAHEAEIPGARPMRAVPRPISRRASYAEIANRARTAATREEQAVVLEAAVNNAMPRSLFDLMFGSHEVRAAKEISALFPEQQRGKTPEEMALLAQKTKESAARTRLATERADTEKVQREPRKAKTEAEGKLIGERATTVRETREPEKARLGALTANIQARTETETKTLPHRLKQMDADTALDVARRRTDDVLRDPRRREIEARIEKLASATQRDIAEVGAGGGLRPQDQHNLIRLRFRTEAQALLADKRAVASLIQKMESIRSGADPSVAKLSDNKRSRQQQAAEEALTKDGGLYAQQAAIDSSLGTLAKTMTKLGAAKVWAEFQSELTGQKPVRTGGRTQEDLEE